MFTRALGALCALLGYFASAYADPRDYGRVVAFGDSLSDNGNLYQNTGQPALPYNQRFTNGHTWVEYLAGTPPSLTGSTLNRFWGTPVGGVPFSGPLTVSGSVDTAVGGATAGGVTQSPGPYVSGGKYTLSSEAANIATVPPGGIPSVQQQISLYTGAAENFGSSDLVSVQGGANDLFNFFNVVKGLQGSNATPTPGALMALGNLPAVAKQTGNYELANIKALTSAGAKTIIVSNIPDIGATPSFNTTILSGSATAATDLYNATLVTGTRQLAMQNPGVNYVQMDWAALFGIVRANPAAFGFDPALIKTSCVKSDASGNFASVCSLNAAEQNKYLFWDGVHPTDIAHQYLAQYASLLLSTEETGKAVGALGQVSLSNRLEASDIIFRRGVSPLGETRNGLYAEVIGSTASFDGSSTRFLGNSSYDYDLGGVRAGFDASDGPLAIGASISYQTGNLSGRQLHSDIETTAVDTYALLRFSPFFVGVEGGFSKNNYDNIKRDTGFPTVRSDSSTSGVDSTVAATIGSQFQSGGITLTPAARAGYASVGIDAFEETAPVLALQYGDRDITTGFWTVRIRAATPLAQFGRANLYGEVGYEDLFSTDDLYSAKLANNTAHAVNINDDLEGRGFFLKTGVAGYIAQNIKVTGEYGLSLQNGAGDVHTGRLRLTIPLGGDGLALPE